MGGSRVLDLSLGELALQCGGGRAWGLIWHRLTPTGFACDPCVLGTLGGRSSTGLYVTYADSLSAGVERMRGAQDCEEAQSLDPREFAAWFNEVSLHTLKILVGVSNPWYCCLAQVLTRAVCHGQGNVQMRLGQFSRALASYRRAADLAPGVSTCANLTLSGQADCSASCCLWLSHDAAGCPSADAHACHSQGFMVCSLGAAGRHQRGTDSGH